MSKTKEVSLHELWQKECKTEKESTPVHIFEARTQMPAHLFQGALLCVIAIGIIGICAGAGVFKGIIDSAPTITLEDATPTRYSSFIYDSKGNQMAKLIAEDSNRVPVTMVRFPPIWQTPLSPSRMSVFTSTTVSTSWGFSVPA